MSEYTLSLKTSIEGDLENIKRKFEERYNTLWISRRELIEQNKENLIGSKDTWKEMMQQLNLGIKINFEDLKGVILKEEKDMKKVVFKMADEDNKGYLNEIDLKKLLVKISQLRVITINQKNKLFEVSANESKQFEAVRTQLASVFHDLGGSHDMEELTKTLNGIIFKDVKELTLERFGKVFDGISSILSCISLSVIHNVIHATTEKNEFTTFDDQVAGHKGVNQMMKDPSGNKILKPINEKEFSFYEKFEELRDQVRDPLMEKLFPLFFGRMYIPNLSHNVPKHFIIMQNLTKGMGKPCVCDLKLGGNSQDSSDNNLTSFKKFKQNVVQFLTTSSVLGFRIVGMRVFDPKINDFFSKDMVWGTKLSESTMPQALELYLTQNEKIIIEVLDSIISQLNIILSWVQKQRKFLFLSSSILIMYDAENKVPPKVSLIDFAHSEIHENGEHPDIFYIFGINNLISILSDIRERHSTKKFILYENEEFSNQKWVRYGEEDFTFNIPNKPLTKKSIGNLEFVSQLSFGMLSIMSSSSSSQNLTMDKFEKMDNILLEPENVFVDEWICEKNDLNDKEGWTYSTDWTDKKWSNVSSLAKVRTRKWERTQRKINLVHLQHVGLDPTLLYSPRFEIEGETFCC